MTEIPTLESRLDAWENAYTQLGIQGRDQTISSVFRRGNGLDTGQIYALVECDGLFARMMESVPEDATRRWISIQGQTEDGQVDDDFGRSVLDAMDELGIQEGLYQALRLENIDGGSACIMGVNDGQDPAEELDIDRVRSFDFFHVVERSELSLGPIVKDPMSVYFREPEYYEFAGGLLKSGMQRVHSSRVIRFAGIAATPQQMEMRAGWGVPYAERVYDAVRRFGTLWGYVEALFKDLVQGVMKIGDLTAILAHPEGKTKLFNRLQAMSLMASSFNSVIIDKDFEDYEKRTMSVAGISDLILRVMDSLPAVSGIPLSRLFGQPPSGLSTDDAAGTRTYYDMVANTQRRKLRKPLMRIIECILAAQKGPTGGQAPEQWDFTFLPLTEPTGKEDAEERQIQANTDKAYVDMGAISPEEVRARLANDPKSPYVIDLSMEIEQPVENDPNYVP